MCELCSTTRRRFLRNLAAGTAAAWGAGAMGGATAILSADRARAAEPVVLGKGRYRYQVLEGWGELPPGMTYGDSAAVCVDSKDNVYVFTRGAHPVIVFDRNGKFLRSWGQDIGFTNPHGAAIGPDDLLYLTDDHGHTVRKCTPDGKVLLLIGTPKTPAPRFSGDPFNRCTHTALSPQGDIYVSDGYQNARVHKFSPDGKLLFSWGEPGTDPGQFNLVHNIACDDEGLVYVADRENHRVQVFDGNGKYQGQWNNLMRPCGLFVTRGKDPLGFIGELGPETVATLTKDVPNLGPRLTVVSAKGELLAHLGTRPIGEGVGQFIAPHGIAVDSRGDIYVAEVANTYWPILYGKKPDHELRSFQKLVRLG
ncbi:MAG TPA: peptidyl-alpha-hydroxyglycine alpha-amidating lyase family protein [Burkholderiales bacterium]|nr:peptidyl-alpha-hydroxyglycine alpha-amidating lyase family protein [Burkholderiales bacterium]